MDWLKTTWRHDDPEDPVVVYSEVDDERWELRKVEVFADGRMTWGDESAGLARLADQRLPTDARIREVEPYHEDLRLERIRRDEFEAIWSRARAPR